VGDFSLQDQCRGISTYVATWGPSIRQMMYMMRARKLVIFRTFIVFVRVLCCSRTLSTLQYVRNRSNGGRGSVNCTMRLFCIQRHMHVAPQRTCKAVLLVTAHDFISINLLRPSHRLKLLHNTYVRTGIIALTGGHGIMRFPFALDCKLSFGVMLW